MKIICKDKIIDLSKFETVRYRKSLFESDSYPVEAVRHESSGGIFGGTTTVTEEIVRFVHEEGAISLVKEITNKWIAEEKSFDVEKWLNEPSKNKHFTNNRKRKITNNERV